jgi:hypothetical protein
VYKRIGGAEKCADFLEADDWMKREWPILFRRHNADKTGHYFRAMP